jgi:phenylalanyl-tRNA synthetase beta chain
MKASLSWLRDYVKVDVPVADIVKTFVETGTEVDRVLRGPEGVIVARITALKAVPKSTRGVQLADLDCGEEEPVRVLTGAPNVKVGDLVPWAKPGAVLPGMDKPIEVKTMLGHKSPGMLCSAAELGISDDAEGIFILKEGIPGAPLHDVLEFDTVLSVEVTPNRPDSMCHLGLARELSAGLGEEVEPPRIAVPEALMSSMQAQSRVSVAVDTEGCRRFAVRVIEGIAAGPSPEWLQRRLRAVGLRPINNIVDVTNYVACEMGQPLHAFDLDKFNAAGGKDTARVVVRDAKPGERIELLDESTRDLVDEDLLVCSGDTPVSLAGVMGGISTAVDMQTKRVLLESAAWDGVTVRATSRRLGLRSDASTLFEKGLSDAVVVSVLDRAAGLIAELGNGHVLQGVVDVWEHPLPTLAPITCSAQALSSILGYDVDPGDATSVLARLGFATELRDELIVTTPPTFRRDVSNVADVAEEVGRVLGYDRVPSTLPGRRVSVKTFAAEPSPDEASRDLMLGAGFDEAITWSFVSPKSIERVRGIGGERKPIPVLNPLSEEWSVMRTTLLPGLCETLATNVNYGSSGVALFEIGRVFWEGERKGQAAGSTPDGADANLKPLPAEPLVVGLASHSDDANSSAAALLHAQATLKAIAEQIGGTQLRVEPAEVAGLHPGRSASLKLGDTVVGVLGELTAKTADGFGIRDRATVGEVRLDLIAPAVRSVRYRHPPRFPAVIQDLSVVVDGSVPAGSALAAISETGGNILEKAELYDEFRDPRLGEGKKGWTFRLTFRAPDHTLKSEEAKVAQDAITVALNVRCGATVRR